MNVGQKSSRTRQVKTRPASKDHTHFLPLRRMAIKKQELHPPPPPPPRNEDRSGSLFLQSKRHHELQNALPGLFLQDQQNLPGRSPGGPHAGGGAERPQAPRGVGAAGPARSSGQALPAPARQRSRRPPRTCTMMAMRSESLGMLSLHFLQEARPLLAYSTR